MHTYRIAVLPGDGIGQEVTAQAVLALQAAAQRFGFAMEFAYADVGGGAYEKYGTPMPEDVLPLCRSCDAVLLGAVGGTQWDELPPPLRPEQALFSLRSGLGLYANLRPAQLHEALKAASPLRADILGDGLDILIVRELTGGIYFGERGRTQIDGAQAAFDTELYSVPEVERIARMGFECAMKRGGRLCSVDKANVLESSRLWREVVSALADQYPQVELTHMLVDNAAMQLVRNPRQFDVIVTSNIFGDILSDEASQLTGSIGMLPSASLGARGGMYEPVHGSAPDIAGQDIANPLAAIGSAAMLLRYTLGLGEAADAVESAISRALDEGLRTADIAAGMPAVGTKRMGAAVASYIQNA